MDCVMSRSGRSYQRTQTTTIYDRYSRNFRLMDLCQFDCVPDGRRCERCPTQPDKDAFYHGDSFSGIVTARGTPAPVCRLSSRPMCFLLLWRFINIEGCEVFIVEYPVNQ